VGNKRAEAIDAAVESAVRGTPAKPAAPKTAKPIWEQMGMTLEEYRRAQEQRAMMDRVRKAQSNPGN